MDPRRFLTVMATSIWLAGCSSQPVKVPVEVKVPVPVMPKAPEALVVPYKPRALPEFVPPNDPRASAALTVEGAQAYRALIRDLVARDAAWRAWATK